MSDPLALDAYDEQLRQVCATLQSVAESFPADSDEARAVRDAALAYTVVFQHEALKRNYEKLRLAFGGQLTEEMTDDLRRHGIDPDELESDGGTGTP